MPLDRVYQLDLITPGISPWRAIFRKQSRQIPNRRIKARGRPQMGQRLYLRVLNFGSRLALAISDFLATKISFSTPERHTQQLQKNSAFFIRLGRGYDGNVQSLDLVNFIVIDFRKNDLLPDAQGIIPPAIKGLP